MLSLVPKKLRKNKNLGKKRRVLTKHSKIKEIQRSKFYNYLTFCR